MTTPEQIQAPPVIFYKGGEARKYTSSSRIIKIQAKLSERALELLDLPEDDVPRLLLDIDVALEREAEAEGYLILCEMGQGLGLRPGVIDGAISISAVQWLCNADKSSHDPRKRLKAFFESLYRSLSRGARAVLQVDLLNVMQLELILSFAIRAGFAGSIVVDYPHSSKSRKGYIVLTCGPPSLNSATPGIIEDKETKVCVSYRQRPKLSQKERRHGRGRRRSKWALKKKEQMCRKGRIVPPDS